VAPHRRRVAVAAVAAVAALVPLAVLAVPAPGPGGSTAAAAAGTPPADSAVPFGTTPVGANTVANPNAPVVGIAATPGGGGYWLVGSDGGIFSYGDAGFAGSPGALHLDAPVVGMAPTPDGRGYWLAARDGGVFAYGDAAFSGSRGGQPLNAPIVGMAATPDGRGYWLVASDGGIFAYGDAGFAGSRGGQALNAPIVGMAATPDGRGYWLVASDGGIFAYGDAGFAGSAGALHLNAPVVGMAATPDGGGYWLVASDGGVFTYGDAPYFGSLGGAPGPDAVVGLAAAAGGRGYWLAVGSPLAGKVVGIDPGHNGANGTAPSVVDQPVFNGVGYEPCDTSGTATDGGYSEAQFNFNVATDLQADLEAEGATVVMTRPDDNGVGPCVTTRAQIINGSRADVAVDIHADGGPAGGRGFTVLEPVPVGPNDAVVTPSDIFATTLRDVFASSTSMPVSDYDGIDGLQPRNDLAGLNLTTVPKVLIEIGNMRNATDAALLVTPAFQQSAAAAIARAVTDYLTGRPASA
jgi:N-acetylmuramoyl-L-alanine amidase